MLGGGLPAALGGLAFSCPAPLCQAAGGCPSPYLWVGVGRTSSRGRLLLPGTSLPAAPAVAIDCGASRAGSCLPSSSTSGGGGPPLSASRAGSCWPALLCGHWLLLTRHGPRWAEHLGWAGLAPCLWTSGALAWPSLGALRSVAGAFRLGFGPLASAGSASTSTSTCRAQVPEPTPAEGVDTDFE